MAEDDFAQARQLAVANAPDVAPRAERFQDVRDQIVDDGGSRVLRVADIERIPLVNIAPDIPIYAGVRVGLAPSGVEQHFAVDIHRLLNRVALGPLEPSPERVHALDITVHFGPQDADRVNHAAVKDRRRACRPEIQCFGVKAPGGGQIQVFLLVNLAPLGGRNQPQHEVAGQPIDRGQRIVALLGDQKRAALQIVLLLFKLRQVAAKPVNHRVKRR